MPIFIGRGAPHLNTLLTPKCADGALVEFASVVDAVHCAVEIQRRMSERNANVPDDRRIEFRIGMNLGDVIVEPNDIYGDGVNVAARLEGLADPGGLCISHTAYDQVRDKVSYPFVDRGEHSVKNISRPVRVYNARFTDPGMFVSRLTFIRQRSYDRRCRTSHSCH